MSDFGDKSPSEKMQAFFKSCGFPFVTCFNFLHEKGITPYVYNTEHSDVSGDVRYEHFKATFYVTAALAFTVMTAIGAADPKAVFDTEEKVWSKISHTLATVGVLAVIDAAAAGAMALGHKGAIELKHWWNGRNNPDYQPVQMIETSRGGIHEGTALVDAQGRHVKWSVANLVAPATPLKTAGWTAALGALATLMYFAVEPQDFAKLSESDAIHAGAVAVTGLLTGVGAGLAFLGGHMLRAKIDDKWRSDKVPSRAEEYQQLPTHTISVTQNQSGHDHTVFASAPQGGQQPDQSAFEAPSQGFSFSQQDDE